MDLQNGIYCFGNLFIIWGKIQHKSLLDFVKLSKYQVELISEKASQNIKCKKFCQRVWDKKLSLISWVNSLNPWSLVHHGRYHSFRSYVLFWKGKIQTNKLWSHQHWPLAQFGDPVGFILCSCVFQGCSNTHLKQMKNEKLLLKASF